MTAKPRCPGQASKEHIEANWPAFTGFVRDTAIHNVLIVAHNYLQNL
jgi:hypothetical protein